VKKQISRKVPGSKEILFREEEGGKRQTRGLQKKRAGKRVIRGRGTMVFVWKMVGDRLPGRDKKMERNAL